MVYENILLKLFNIHLKRKDVVTVAGAGGNINNCLEEPSKNIRSDINQPFQILSTCFSPINQ